MRKSSQMSTLSENLGIPRLLCRERAFACWFMMLKGGLSTTAVDAEGPVMCPGGFAWWPVIQKSTFCIWMCFNIKMNMSISWNDTILLKILSLIRLNTIELHNIAKRNVVSACCRVDFSSPNWQQLPSGTSAIPRGCLELFGDKNGSDLQVNPATGHDRHGDSQNRINPSTLTK